MPESMADWQRSFLRSHQLDESYLSAARKWFDPLAAGLAAFRIRASAPILVAVNGSQGSGKSTLADYLVKALEYSHQLSAVTLSLDDFYCTRAQRIQLSQAVHPMLATRGVPGTHDMALLNATLDALLSTDQEAPIKVPRFNKAIDDRQPESDWDAVRGKVDIVILEGWCMGVRPESEQQLERPVNVLEAREDPQVTWRSYVNDIIATDFLPLYGRVDQWLMLQAPSFDCVFRWRLEQEQKLARGALPGVASKVMNEEKIASFIQHYQRITERCLIDLPARVNYLYQLDENRDIIDFVYRENIPERVACL